MPSGAWNCPGPAPWRPGKHLLVHVCGARVLPSATPQPHARRNLPVLVNRSTLAFSVSTTYTPPPRGSKATPIGSSSCPAPEPRLPNSPIARSPPAGGRWTVLPETAPPHPATSRHSASAPLSLVLERIGPRATPLPPHDCSVGRNPTAMLA